MSEITLPKRPVNSLCVSSADSTFVFGPIEAAIWHVESSTGGKIVAEPDAKMATELEATLRSPRPAVHITFDCDDQMYHGQALLRSVDPEIVFEIEGSLAPA